MHHALLRYVSLGVYGLANMHLSLIEGTITFIVRESITRVGIRLVAAKDFESFYSVWRKDLCPKLNDKYDESVGRYAYQSLYRLGMVMAMGISMVISYIWLVYPPVGIDDAGSSYTEYMCAVLLYVMGSMMQLACHPSIVMAQANQTYSKKYGHGMF